MWEVVAVAASTLTRTLHFDICQADEHGLPGQQRLDRLRTTMSFPTIDAAAEHLGVNQVGIVRQLQPRSGPGR
jgi:hypothetical protein